MWTLSSLSSGSRFSCEHVLKRGDVLAATRPLGPARLILIRSIATGFNEIFCGPREVTAIVFVRPACLPASGQDKKFTILFSN